MHTVCPFKVGNNHYYYECERKKEFRWSRFPFLPVLPRVSQAIHAFSSQLRTLGWKKWVCEAMAALFSEQLCTTSKNACKSAQPTIQRLLGGVEAIQRFKGKTTHNKRSHSGIHKLSYIRAENVCLQSRKLDCLYPVPVGGSVKSCFVTLEFPYFTL